MGRVSCEGFSGVAAVASIGMFQSVVVLSPAEQASLPEHLRKFKVLTGGLFETAEEAAKATDRWVRAAWPHASPLLHGSAPSHLAPAPVHAA